MPASGGILIVAGDDDFSIALNSNHIERRKLAVTKISIAIDAKIGVERTIGEESAQVKTEVVAGGENLSIGLLRQRLEGLHIDCMRKNSDAIFAKIGIKLSPGEKTAVFESLE